MVGPCFTDDTSFNPPSQIMIPFLRIRKPRYRERNEVVQGQPIQEAGASRELLSIPWPQALSASPLGIWAVSRTPQGCQIWGQETDKGWSCPVSLVEAVQQFTAFNPHACSSLAFSHAVQVWDSMWRGTEAWFLLSPPFLFVCLFHLLRLLAFIVYY